MVNDATSPHDPPVATGAVRVADRLGAALDEVLGDELRRRPGQRTDLYQDGLVIRSHDLLERCPRRAAHPADDYDDRVATTRRRVGLLVLRRLWDAAPSDTPPGWRIDASSLVPTVRAVFADPEVWPPRLWAWIRSLDPAGRAAVAAGAVTWCDGVVRLLGTVPDVTWTDPTLPVRRDVPGRAVGLAATIDATRRSTDGERLLVVTGSASSTAHRVLAGHAALVRTAVGRRDRVARVTLASPSSGELHQVPVDDDLLDLAVDRVAEHAALRIRPDDAPPRPSRSCSYCHLLEECGAGLEHVGVRPDVTGQVAAGVDPTT